MSDLAGTCKSSRAAWYSVQNERQRPIDWLRTVANLNGLLIEPYEWGHTKYRSLADRHLGCDVGCTASATGRRGALREANVVDLTLW